MENNIVIFGWDSCFIWLFRLGMWFSFANSLYYVCALWSLFFHVKSYPCQWRVLKGSVCLCSSFRWPWMCSSVPACSSRPTSRNWVLRANSLQGYHTPPYWNWEPLASYSPSRCWPASHYHQQTSSSNTPPAWNG